MSTTLKWKDGDIFFDNDGKSKTISDDEKLAQDIAWFILGEESLTNIANRTFDKITPGVANAITKLKFAQATKTNLTDRERISGIEEIIVIPDPTELKTAAYFYVRVSTEAGDSKPFLFDAQTLTTLSHLLPPNF